MLVRFNDRGPYMAGRVADLSLRTAQLLGFAQAGTTRVRIKYVGPAPLNGDDTRYLMASLTDNGGYRDEGPTRVASVEPRQLAPQYRSSSAVMPRTRPASREMTQVLAAVDALSYANGPTVTGAAAAAAEAMASASPDLTSVPAGLPVDGSTPVAMDLGTYSDAQARDVAMQFAVLGAVDETPATTDDGTAGTALSLSYLKPGVTPQDVIDLAHELGLSDAVLY
jgi:rare lipoprotein A